jgi:tetratricopeptide (TPR) repeat protein
MQGPAIHYNIGVAAYRSGNLARAERAFREVAQTPAMAALAHYNLGLVAQRRADSTSARDWFERAARESTDERLSALAARQLDELPAAPTRAVSSWYARAGIGYDDNVALRSESIDAPGNGEGDSLAELLVAGGYSFRPNWRVDGAAGLSRYASLDEFDQTALSVGLTRGLEFAGWSIDAGANVARLSLGGDVYEQSTAATAQAKRALGSGFLRGQLRVAAVDGEGDFSGLSGTRSGLGLEYEWTVRSLTFAVHTRAEKNDSRDDLYASRWFEAGADVRWAASPVWTFDAGIKRRQIRHPEQSSTQDAWNDRRTLYQLQAMRFLWKQMQLVVRYEHENARSPVDAYEYDRNLAVVSLETWR